MSELSLGTGRAKDYDFGRLALIIGEERPPAALAHVGGGGAFDAEEVVRHYRSFADPPSLLQWSFGAS